MNYIPHCDEPGCDLGTLEYTCPDCRTLVTDYDSWFKAWAAYMNDEPVLIKCAECKAQLYIGVPTHGQYTPEPKDVQV